MCTFLKVSKTLEMEPEVVRLPGGSTRQANCMNLKQRNIKGA